MTSNFRGTHHLWRTAAVPGNCMVMPTGWNSTRTAIWGSLITNRGTKQGCIVPSMDHPSSWSQFIPRTKIDSFMRICQRLFPIARQDGLVYIVTRKVMFLICFIIKCLQSLYSLSRCTSYRKISWSLEAARFELRLFKSFRNLTSTLAAALPRCLPNFRTIRSL